MKLVGAARFADAPIAVLAAAAGSLVGWSLWHNPSLLTATVVVLFGLAVLRWPEAGLCVLILCVTILPFGVVPMRLVFAPTFVDVATTALLAAVAIRLSHHHDSLNLTPAHGLILLFIGLAAVSLLFGLAYSPVSAEELRLLLKLVDAMLLTISVTQVVRSETVLRTVIGTAIVGGSVASISAILLHAMSPEAAIGALSSLGSIGYPTGPDVLRPIEGTTTLRATGTSVDPNVLGGMLTVVAVLAVSQLLSPRPVLARPLLGIAAATMVVAIVLSYSRSAWIGLAAGLVLLVTVERRLIFALPPIVFAFVALPQGRAIMGRLVNALTLQDQATAMRITEYRAAIHVITQYPVFGIGFGGPPAIDAPVGVSSMYLSVAEQMGLVGLVVFGLVLVSTLRRGFGAPDRASAITRRGLQAAFVSALVAGVFDHYFFNLRFPHMAALFWLLVGLVLAQRLIAVTEVPEERSRSFTNSVNREAQPVQVSGGSASFVRSGR